MSVLFAYAMSRVLISVVPPGERLVAHLALEAGEVETLPAAQGDFLMNRKICRHFERKISPTKTIMKN